LTWPAERGLAVSADGWDTHRRTTRPLNDEGLSVNNRRHWGNDTATAPASGQRPRLGTGPYPDQTGAIRAQVRAVVADYDRVRTWSDPSARQCELTRIGATAVDLLRRLGGEPR
jgi:hypothetical protein